MRVFGRFFVSVLLLVVISLVFLPPLVGLGVKKWINIGLYMPANTNQKILDYRRGWFSSDIASKITVNDPSLRAKLSQFGLDPAKLPAQLDLVLLQHIQHGPVFYVNNKRWSQVFGLVAIDRKILIPKSEQALFASFGIKNSILDQDRTVLTFSGNLHSHIDLKNFSTLIPVSEIQLQLRGLSVDIWQNLYVPHVKGEIVLDYLRLYDKSTTLEFPKTAIQFNFKKEKNGLWLGTHELRLSQIILKDAQETQAVQVNDVQSNGSLHESSGLIAANKEISFKSMQYNNQVLGPFTLKLSAQHINADAIANIINTYQAIRQQGELYESQLKQKIVTMLPTVITSGTNIQINDLNVMTGDGELQMQAKLSWPSDNFAAPTSLADLVKTSKLQASLKIAAPLADQLVALIAKLTYIGQIPEEERLGLLDINENVNIANQQNNYTIMSLLRDNLLYQEDGLELLTLQQAGVSPQEYYEKVRNLLLNRKIKLETAYLLDWLYWDLTIQNNFINQRLAQYRDQTEQQIHTELNEFVRLGYINHNKNDYSVSLVRQNGTVSVNGKELQ